MSNGGGVDLSELDRVAVQVQQAARSAGFAGNSVSLARRANRPELLDKAIDHARQAEQSASAALVRLLALGASNPGPQVGRDRLPLELLDTPVARRFLAALEAAAEAGAELDRERGWVDADGEPTGHGETLAGMALAMRREIFGPQGRE